MHGWQTGLLPCGLSKAVTPVMRMPDRHMRKRTNVVFIRITPFLYRMIVDTIVR
jgi:hypothetical protein